MYTKRDHEKFLEKMGLSKKQLKSKKKTRSNKVIFEGGYADRYYDDKINGGIEYNPIKPKINESEETEKTIKELNRKKSIGLLNIDASTGPRDLDYPVKKLPAKIKL
ncbi:MAG: hypothetical protein [Caudoviricetes sp.]|nr:MAG: hypothetical protein [Caudoviricetes sp.]